MKQFLVLFGFCLLTASCNWVQVTEEGKTIRIAKADDVANCKRVGKVSAHSKHQIAGFDRNEEKIKTEIERLARNEAAESGLGGDTLVPITSIKDGRQTFAFYRCIQPAVQ